MNSKNLVLLSAVLIVLCFLSPLAKADPAFAITIKGKITEADGNLAPDGLTVEAEIAEKGLTSDTQTELRPDGDNYALTIMGDFLNEDKRPNTGDLVEIVVKDENDKVLGKTSHVITAEEDEAALISLDFQLSGIQVTITPSTIPGDGKSESIIQINVTDNEGNPVEGDTLTVESSLGVAVDNPAPVEGKPGFYQTTYVAPVETGVDTLTITSETLQQSVTSNINLTFADAIIEVELLDESNNVVTSLIADGTSTANIKVTIKKVGTEVPVTDEEVKITTGLGKIEPVTATNNNDGTYTATYTAPTTVGKATLNIATKESGSKTKSLTIEAGPPANVDVSVSPSVITANGVSTATATAIVTDENGNPINDAEVTFEIVEGEGTIQAEGIFTKDGKYSSTYTSPILEEEGSAKIKASVGDISSDEIEIKLVLEPPAENTTMVIHGAIYYEDGETRAAYGLEVTVENLTKGITLQPVISQKRNGHDYSVTFFDIKGGIVATTGDEINIKITKDGEPVEFLAPDMPYRLSSEEVEAGNVTINITTDIKPQTDILAVRGAIYYKDRTARISDELEVTVKNLTNDLSLSITSGKLDGHDYNVVFLGPVLNTDIVATTGDKLEITLKKPDGTPVNVIEPAEPHTLTTAEVVAGELEINLKADLGAEAKAMHIAGTVYKEDGTTPAAGYKVEITNPSTGITSEDTSNDSGEYSITLVDYQQGGDVIYSGDNLKIKVFDGTGKLVGVGSVQPTTSQILSGHTVASEIVFAVYDFSVDFPRRLELPEEIDSIATLEFTVTIEDEITGDAVAGEEVTAEVAYGQISDFVDNGDGTYTATYSVMGKELPFDGDDRVDVVFTIGAGAQKEDFELTIEDGTRPTPIIDAIINGNLVESELTEDGDRFVGYAAIRIGDRVVFDATRSFDNVGIAEYEWDFDWIKEEITPEIEEEITQELQKAGIELSPDKKTDLLNTMQDLSPNIAESVTEKLELSEEVDEEDIIDLLPEALPEGLKAAKTMFPDAKTDDEVVDEVIRLAETQPDMMAELIAENIPPESIPEKYRSAMRAQVEPADIIQTREFLFPKPGIYTVELRPTDVAGNRTRASNKATFVILVEQLELGGITVDSRHYQQLIDDVVYQLTKDLVDKYKLPVPNLFSFIRSGSYRSMIIDMLPAGLPIPAKDAIDLFINKNIEPGPNTALGNFGNAIIPAPISELPYPLDPNKGLAPTLASDNLSLYLQVPNRDAGKVVFNLNGTTIEAKLVQDKISKQFMLEEEQALLALPSWPGIDSENPDAPPVFSNVYLYYAPAQIGSGPLSDIPPTAPYDTSCLDVYGENCPNFGDYVEVPMQMERDSNGKVIWTVNSELEVGNYYFYFFKVEIDEPIKMQIPGQDEVEISEWTMPDPKNLQITDRGLVEYMITEELKAIVEEILEPVIKAVAEGATTVPEITITDEQMAKIQEIGMAKGESLYNYILESKDLMVVSRISVPAPKPIEDAEAQFSLWTGDFDLSNLPDGNYEISAVVQDASGNVLDELSAKQIVIDRNSVATTLTLTEGKNAATYTYKDESGQDIIVASVAEEDSTTLNLIASGIQPDYYGVAFQILEYPSGQTWQPVIASTQYGSLIDPYVGALEGFGITKEQLGLAYDVLNSIPFVFVPEDTPIESLSVEMMLKPYSTQEQVKQYWLRSVAIDNAMNIGSGMVPIRLDIVPRETDKAVVSLDDIIYPDTETVELTVEFSKRTVHPVDVVVEYKAGDADWVQIGETISLARDEGSNGWSKTIEWTPNFAELFASAGDNKAVQLRAVATNAIDIVDTEPEEATALLRFHPEIIAFEATANQFSADSGAPKGTVELVAYTPIVSLISPEVKNIDFEYSIDGENWDTLESDNTPEDVTGDQVAIIQALVEQIVEGEMKSAMIADSYSKWTLSYDTTQADDTITKDSPGARDYSKDETPYLIGSTVIDQAGTKYPAEREVVLGDRLSVDYPSVVVTGEKIIPVSVDNVDDIGPVTGTEIVSIVDDAGEISSGDVVGGIIEEGKEYNITITTTPLAARDTFDKVKLFINDEESDYEFEKTETGYVLSINLLNFENGDYKLQALAIDEVGNIEEANPELAFNITVANYEPPTPDEMADFEAATQVKSRIGKFNLAEAVKPFPASGILTFYVTLEGTMTDQIDLLYELVQEYSMSNRMNNRLQAGKSAKDAGLLTVSQDGALFTLQFDTTGVVDGEYNFQLEVTKRTTKKQVNLLNVAIDNTLPEVSVAAPVNGIEVSQKPTIVINYNDVGTGIQTPDDVVIEVVKLPDENAIELQKDIRDKYAICSFDEKLSPGAYQISVDVTDKARNQKIITSQFTVEAIEEDNSPPLILSTSPQGTLTSADVTISVIVIDEKINEEESGVDSVTVSIDGGEAQDMTFDKTSATYETTLDDGTHSVNVVAKDKKGNEANALWSFTIDLDKTAPVISSALPQGIVTEKTATLSVKFSDESGIDDVQVRFDGGTEQAMTLNAEQTGATYKVANLSEGTHTAEVTVTDASAKQNKASYEWSFIVDTDTVAPTIGSVSPQGIVVITNPTISVSFNDDSGIFSATVKIDGGTSRTMQLNSNKTGATYDANLDKKTHTAEVTVTDNSANRNKATYEWSFTVDPDTTPPTISSVSPQGVVTVKDVTLSVAFSDESGISSATIKIDGGTSRTMQLNSNKASATYDANLDKKTHTAEVTVTDASANKNKATYEWSFTVDPDTTPPSITSNSPVGIIREEKPMIAVTVNDESGVDDSVSVSIEGPVNIRNKKMELSDTSATYDVTDSLKEGSYNVTVTAKDQSASQNEAKTQWSFTVEFDTEPPVVTIVSPAGGSRITERKPKIRVNYSDKSEINLDSVNLTITGPAGDAFADVNLVEKDQNKATYECAKEMEYGEYTVEFEVSDEYENAASVEWSFFVESDVPEIQVPRNYPNPFSMDTGTNIAFTLTKQARITIKVYDMTTKLVAKPVEDEMKDAGPQEIPWDGKLSNGDELAKGVYFCQIIADGGLNTEQVVIKMALFR